MKKSYDIIGDIHGCAEELEALLLRIGYADMGGIYKHPERQAIFLGDFIDRGPNQKGVLDIVRPMIETKEALAVMGNHEFNAICYATEGEEGYIRPHTNKNTKQHKAFLDEFPFGSDEHHDVITWFKTLPVYLDLEDIGIVHACWCEKSFKAIESFLNADKTIFDAAYLEYANDMSHVYIALERILKGPEYSLPPEIHFHDKDGHKRTNCRVRWWKDSHLPTSQRLEFPEADLTEDQRQSLNSRKIPDVFNVPEKPTFIGHYWLQGIPKPLSKKVVCVDYSVAKGGTMTAYQWNGENEISENNFVSI
ncbi:MAG: metallophosphoesterase [Alphaproteobacteria bacterium]|nr:metallophosphoesterase [Alphaproteobacteria bacterium]